MSGAPPPPPPGPGPQTLNSPFAVAGRRSIGVQYHIEQLKVSRA
jgi:hypothetical protein